MANGWPGFPGSSTLRVATVLSLVLHALLIWPLPLSREAPDRPTPHAGTLRLVPAPQSAASVIVASNEHVAPKARLAIHRPPVAVASVGRIATPGPGSSAPAPAVAESSLRAFRYAIARSLAQDGALRPAPGVRMVILLQLHARRIVAVSLVHSSGRSAVDEQVLAAFGAAGRAAAMQVDLPAHGFVVELELDGGAADSGEDEGSTVSVGGIP